MKKMNPLYLLLFIGTLVTTCQGQQRIIAPGATVEKLAEGFLFTEGPAADRSGNVYFTDQPNNRILKYSVEGELSVFLDNSGRANGLYFDKEDVLFSCSDQDNELWKISPEGLHQALVTSFEGKLLNGPNDLWIHPEGGLYFTDPLYARDYWTRSPEVQQAGEQVYFLSADYQTLIPVATDLEKPNGIIGTQDGKRLYVADAQAGKTYVYDIQPDGTLSNKQLFAPLGSDGMTMDKQGNIYLTGRGVTVFNPKGEQIEHIAIDANWTANVCFGGKDRKTLFITASQYLYALQMNVAGY
jgi:gluconolactonase